MKILLIIIIAVILISTAIYTIQKEQLEAIDPIAVQDYLECAPDAFAKAQEKLSVKIRTPTYLPDGYKLVAVDMVSGEGGWVLLYYWDKDSCPTNINYSVSSDGLITVGLYLSTIDNIYDDGDRFVNNTLESYRNDNDTIADVKPVTLSNGYKGIGWEPFVGVNKVVNIKYINGTEVAEIVENKPLSMPGRVEFVHEEDKVLYTVSANLPLEELTRIAESIQ